MKKNNIVFIICLIILILAIGVGAFLFIQNTKNKNVMMEWQQSSVTDFHEARYREHILSATFTETKEIPNNSVKQWDVSKTKDESVIAYIVNDQNDSSNYHLYIGADGKVIAPESLSHIFHNFPLLTKVDMSSLDATNVKIMWKSFSSSPNLVSVSFPGSTPNLENINAIFSGCASLKSINLASMELNKVEDIGYAFSGCSKLTGVDFGEFTGENLKITEYAFSGCNSLTNLDLRKINPTRLEKAAYMFNWANHLKNLDISQIDFTSVEDASLIFNKMPVDATIYVSSEPVKQWILDLPTTSRPNWTEKNIILR